MHQRSVVRVGASLIVASLALTACGSRSGNDSGGDSGGSTKTAKIGVIAPLSGDLSALGLGIQHSVELAVKQANDSNAIPGWKLEVVPKDDEAKPDPGKNAATALAGDKDVIGVVGTLNTSVSQQVQPVLASAKIVQVSPANTGPGLTQGAELADRPEAAVPDVLPHLHHRRGPGSVRGSLPVRDGEDHQGRHDPRQEGVRPGSGRHLHRGVQEAGWSGRRGPDHQPGRLELPGRDLLDQAVRPAGDLLRW